MRSAVKWTGECSILDRRITIISRPGFDVGRHISTRYPLRCGMQGRAHAQRSARRSRPDQSLHGLGVADRCSREPRLDYTPELKIIAFPGTQRFAQIAHRASANE